MHSKVRLLSPRVTMRTLRACVSISTQGKSEMSEIKCIVEYDV